jgi:phosphoribosylamine--glycine ligase
VKILLLGSGGREHALVWKLRQSAQAEKIWCAPGNAGIAHDAKCVALSLADVKATADLAEKLGVDLTIAGPELPLVLGVADEFARRGLLLLGPPKTSAQLEGSKIFAKNFMHRHGIPTAELYGVFDSTAGAKAALRMARWPLVIKADGLCAGKGVLVTSSADEADEFVERSMTRGEFGEAGSKVIFEEGLAGDELSYIILTDGKTFVPMAPARDYKRALDGDKGPNTGGMGAYSIDEILPRGLENKIVDTVVWPTLDGLAADGMQYRGFLYFGLMLTREGPKVLEYNCRLGDPETQAIMLRAEFDLLQACLKAAREELAGFEAKWAKGASAYVVLASKGYPGNPVTGIPIRGLDRNGQISGATVFHSGTKRELGTYYTSGGRVLGVGAFGQNLSDASETCYDVISSIKVEGAFYRKDVGATRPRSERAVGNGRNA